MNLYAGQDREAMREAWRIAWRRHLERLPLEPLQAQMADLIAIHPEYHPRIGQSAPAPGATALETDGAGDNAFLHLALHLALREQLATDRPRGIAELHRRLAAASGESHAAEHRMIEVLAQALWSAQRAARLPDEQRYLEALLQL